MLQETSVAFLLIKILFSTVMSLFLTASFLDFRYSKKLTMLIFGIFMAYVFSTSWFLLESLTLTMFTRFNIFFIAIPTSILFYVLTEDEAAKQLFVCITQINIIIIIWLGGSLINIIFKNSRGEALLVHLLLFSALTMLQYLFIKKYYNENSEAFGCNWILMDSIPVAFFILIWIMVLFPEKVEITYWHFACIFTIAAIMIAVYVVLFISLVKSYYRLEDRMKNNVMTAQLFAQEQYHAIVLKKQYLIQRMSRQVGEASEFLWQGNLGRASDILMDIIDGVDSNNVRVYCTNSRINDVVSFYATQCIESNIRFTCDMNLERRNLPVSEICLILNYGLENAFEASEKLPMEQRFIKLQTRVVQGQFLIRIRNRFNGEIHFVGDLPQTEKMLTGHGYGLASIQAAAKRIRGEMMFKVEDDNFVLDVRVQAEPVLDNEKRG